MRCTGYIVPMEGTSMDGLHPHYAKLDNGRRVIGRVWTPGPYTQARLDVGTRIIAEEISNDVWEFRRAP